ncbi:MFS transporter [Patescibacteria group bacterium]
MDSKSAWQNVRMFKWFATFAEPFFWGPVLILYLINQGGMSLGDIFVMEAIVVLGLGVAEILTGSLADHIGRKKTIVLGRALGIVTVVWFALANSPFDIWMANISWAIGHALVSGADKALVYDSLKAVNKEKLFSKIWGGAMSRRLLLMAFASLAAGLLYSVHPRLPLALSIPGIIVSFIITLKFVEPPRTKSYSAREQVQLIWQGFSLVFTQKNVRWIVLFSAVVAVTLKAWFFTYNPYFELVELDLFWYGVIFFILNIIAAASSRFASSIEKYLGEYRSIVVVVLSLGLGILVMGFFPQKIMISIITLSNVIRGFFVPFSSAMLNHHVPSLIRATVSSIESSVERSVQFFVLGGLGWMTDAMPLPWCLMVLGGGALAFGFRHISQYNRIFRT